MNTPAHKEISLSSGHVVLVDEEDYERISAYRWAIVRRRDTGKLYAVHTSNRGGERLQILMHSLILGATGSRRRHKIIHVNGNGLDNRRANLKLYDGSQLWYGCIGKVWKVCDGCGVLFQRYASETKDQRLYFHSKRCKGALVYTPNVIRQFLNWGMDNCAFRDCQQPKTHPQWNLCAVHSRRFYTAMKRQAYYYKMALKSKGELNVST